MTEREGGRGGFAAAGRFGGVAGGIRPVGKLFMDYVAEDYLPWVREAEPSSLFLTETRAKALVWELGDLPVSAVTPERLARFRERAIERTPAPIVDRYLDLARRIVDHAEVQAAAVA